MKSIFKSLLVIGLSIMSFSSYAQKTAHLDLDSLLNIMPESKKAKDSLAVVYKQLETMLSNYQKELQDKLAAYQENEAKYTPLVKEQMQKDLQALDQRIRELQVQAQGDYQKVSDALTKPINEKAKKAIEKVAKAKGYKMVIDSSLGVLLYTDPADDIFNFVKAELGIK